MPDFSTILQTPEIRAIVQENLLERAFHDALFPRLLFRGEATPVAWPTGVGDTQIFSAPGLIPVDATPLAPGVDPTPVTYPIEQWEAQLNQYAGTIDTHMPTSITAIANLFLRNAHQLGLQAGQTMNRIVRNKMYGAALAGWTVADGAAVATTALRVKRLNGFTRARNPALVGGSQVRFTAVSASNPLNIVLFDNAVEATNTVIGFTPDVAGDEVGPGVLTLGAATTNVADRAYVLSVDRTDLVRVGGGNKVDDLTPGTDIPTLADVRTAVANFWTNNVPEHPDGRYHCQLDPVSQALIFADPEFQRLLTALPDYYIYRQFALGELLNTVFFRNSECPIVSTVVGGSTATFDSRDPFAGELTTDGAAGGPAVHRMLFTAQGGVFEYFQDLSALITEAGVTGRVGDPRVVNNGIEILSDRIQLVIRGPLNRLQDQVATSWKFIGDWPVRTDAATGDAARIKRFLCVEHAEQHQLVGRTVIWVAVRLLSQSLGDGMAKRKSAKLDPLDSVRISDPADDESEEIKPPKIEEPVKVSKPKKVEAKPVVKAPVAPAAVPKYRVMAMKRMSIRGQMVTFKLGKIISAESHGPGVVEQLQSAGVPLELVE